MKKYWKWIAAVVLVLSVAILALFLFDHFAPPRWSQAEKERVKHTYIYTWPQFGPNSVEDGWEEKWFEKNPIIWYDENGNVEEENVWRYVGTYGDCYAFLLSGVAVDYAFPGEGELPTPYPLNYLSRTVYYPTVATVVLYDAKGNLPTYSSLFGEPARLRTLYDVRDENWLTDEQLEQLTQDIEKIAESHKTPT